MANASSLEEASQTFAATLWEQLAGDAALVRVYATLPFYRLPKAEHDFAVAATRAHSGRDLQPRDRVLTLLGTYGDEPQWRRRLSSQNHLAIPVAEPSFVDRLPMISYMLSELGLSDGFPRPEVFFAHAVVGGVTGVFHVETAAEATDHRGRKVIPDTDFVRRYRIGSVTGMATTFAEGTAAICIIFGHSSLSRRDAEERGALIAAFKVASGKLFRAGRIFS